EALTGHPPLVGPTTLATLRLIEAVDPIPPGQLQPQLPRDVDTICLAALQKDPRRRYASALALADDLRRFLDGRPIQARRGGRLGAWADSGSLLRWRSWSGLWSLSSSSATPVGRLRTPRQMPIARARTRLGHWLPRPMPPPAPAWRTIALMRPTFSSPTRCGR